MSQVLFLLHELHPSQESERVACVRQKLRGPTLALQAISCTRDTAVGELKVDPVPCDMERDTKKSVGPEGGWIWMVWGGVGCVWVLPPAKLRPFVHEVHVQKIRNKKRPPPPILAISAKAIGLLLNVDVELWVTMQNVQLPAWKTTQTSRHTLPAFRVHVHGIYHTSSLPPEKTTQTSRYIITWL